MYSIERGIVGADGKINQATYRVMDEADNEFDAVRVVLYSMGKAPFVGTRYYVRNDEGRMFFIGSYNTTGLAISLLVRGRQRRFTTLRGCARFISRLEGFGEAIGWLEPEDRDKRNVRRSQVETLYDIRREEGTGAVREKMINMAYAKLRRRKARQLRRGY